MTLDHPRLGALVWSPKSLDFQGLWNDARFGKLELRVSPLDHYVPPGPAIETLRPEVERLLDGVAEHLEGVLSRWDAITAAVVDDLLETYNESWRCYEEHIDGVPRPVEREVLDAASFTAKLVPTSVGVSLPVNSDGGFSADVGIDCGDLFWDHGILAELSDGGIYVSMVG